MEIKNLIVESASTIDEMRTLSDQSEFDLVILDAEFPENSPVEEIVSIQEQHASTMFLVFPPDNRQNHPIVGQFRADAFLNQPFYLPDFLDMVEKLVYRTQIQEMKFNESESYSIGDEEKGKIMQQTLSDWVNPTKIGEQLSQAMIESQAQGAFILYDGNPIVYRGDLDESVISEITIHLLRDWDRDKKSDIVRFMRLSADDKDHLIYASNFQEYYLLVLIFEKTLPIMVARSHSTHVGYNLRQIIENEHGTKTTEEFVENDALMDTAEILTPIKSDEDIPSLEDENQLEVSKLIDHLTEIASTGPQDPTKIFQREYKTEENDIDQDVTLPEWLEDDRKDSNEGIDSSNVIEEDDQLKWVKAEGQEETEEIYPDIELDEDSTEEDTVFSKQEKSSDRTNLRRFEQGQPGEEILDSITFPWDQEVDQEIETQKKVEVENFVEEDKIQTFKEFDLEEFQTVKEEIENHEYVSEDALKLAESLSDLDPVETAFHKDTTSDDFLEEKISDKSDRSLDETIPMFVSRQTADNLSALEPIFAGFSSLNYTNILVPRFPKQFLVGDLAKRMSAWMPQLCLAFGWRLERLSVRPQYMQWTINADPTVTPNELIKLVRKETSKRIFKLRPDFAEENPNNDFWAPGFMVLSGYYPPTQQMIIDFIHKTRIRQGLET